MKRTSVLFLVIALVIPSCKEQTGFNDTPEVISGILSDMEENEIDIDLYISVLDLGGDSLNVDYFLLNNTTVIDTIIVSSGSPVNISYRYGKNLSNSNAKWIFPSDARIFPLPSGSSTLIESRVIKTRIEGDYLLRAIYTFSVPEGSKKGQYWLVSEPVLIKKYSD